jgi:hypothetical protein
MTAPCSPDTSVRDPVAIWMNAYADAHLQLTELKKTAAKLVDMARTSGGVAGRDEDLCSACDAVEASLSAKQLPVPMTSRDDLPTIKEEEVKDLILKTFTEHECLLMLRTVWKDGIDIELPKPGMMIFAKAVIDLMRAKDAGVAQTPMRNLSDYTDAEISNEWHRRAMLFLGDQRIGVGFSSPPDMRIAATPVSSTHRGER